MRENQMEICMTCTNAKHAGPLTQTTGLYFCGEWVATLQDHTGCKAIVRILVEGKGVGCLDGYTRNESVFADVWKWELAELAAEQNTPEHERNGVVPGRDFPGSLNPKTGHSKGSHERH